MERTLAIIKPDNMKNIIEITNVLYSNNLKIDEYIITKLDEEILKEHYSHMVDKPFYPILRNFIMSSEVIIMILSGDNAVDKLRIIMGTRDSKKTIKDNNISILDNDIAINIIHGSDSVENAEVEIKRFFKKEKRLKK